MAIESEYCSTVQVDGERPLSRLVLADGVLDVLEGRLVPQETGRMTVPQRLAALRYRGTLAKELANARTASLAVELYANLQHVSRLLGMQTQPIGVLAPVARQNSLQGIA
ncbi:hypothetical protein ACTJK4_11970 [Ralstonia sp. 22111]|uniref:hypothetical protein n=1 Tax=Ralstonia sp. 22111 TaxID=3453878 RepID=UPI003F835EE9